MAENRRQPAKNKAIETKEATANIKLPEISLEELYAKASIPAKKEGERRVAAIKKQHPEWSQSDIIKKLERRYITEVTSAGVAVGAAAAVPGVGTMAAITAGTLADATAWVLATSTLVYGMLAVQDVELEDIEYERSLILGIIAGGSAQGTMKKTAERTGQYWGRAAIKKVPGSALKPINKVLGRNFVTKAGSTGVVRLGTAMPFGIGAAIGGTMNYAVALGTIKGIRAALAEAFDSDDDLVEAEVIEPKVIYGDETKAVYRTVDELGL